MIDWAVELRYALTGELYQNTKLTGPAPITCGYWEIFTQGQYTVNRVGKSPSTKDLEAWLAKYIK